MTSKPTKSTLKGYLLIATPTVSDAVFGESLVYICTHDTDGAVGLIINRPLESVTFLELLTQFNMKSPDNLKDNPIFFGGPVDVNRGFILHPAAHMIESSIAINDEIALTANLSFFKEVVSYAAPNDILVTLGYAGWEAGQLEEELKQGQWLCIKPTPAILFGDDHDHKWRHAYESLGMNPAYIHPKTGQA